MEHEVQDVGRAVFAVAGLAGAVGDRFRHGTSVARRRRDATLTRPRSECRLFTKMLTP